MRWRWRWLGQPWFLGSVAVLVVNDRVLKEAFGGWWTGKLSDVVGPVVVATLLGVVVGRTPAVLATAVAFTALKTVPGVAEATAPLLGGVTRRDPTDLLGLVALVPVWHLMADSPRAAITSPARHLVARLPRVVGGAAAVLAVTATSYEPPPAVDQLRVDDGGRLHAKVETRDSNGSWAVSDDGGLTWTGSPTAPRGGATSEQREACRSDGWCFRTSDAGVDERPPGEQWRPSFTITRDEEKLIGYRREGTGRDYRARFGGVVVAPVEGGEHVVVDAEDQGVVVLDTDGEWHRRGVLGAEPVDISGAIWPLERMESIYWWVGPVALIAIVLHGQGVSSPDRRPLRFGDWAGAVALALFLWGAGGAAWAAMTRQLAPPTAVAAVMAVCAVLAVGLPVLLLRRSV